jgi:hypothetical protein
MTQSATRIHQVADPTRGACSAERHGSDGDILNLLLKCGSRRQREAPICHGGGRQPDAQTKRECCFE